MPIVIATAKKLEGMELKNLTVTLTDERHGAVGHKDSNWQQLLDAGFKLTGAVLQPVLMDKPLAETVHIYSKQIADDFKWANYKIALTGIGTDGHTFGIKPKSPAVFSNQLVSGYKGTDYPRLTFTPKAIAGLDEIVVYAAGVEKHNALEQLSQDIPATIQPAQALKQIPNLTIYNDYYDSRSSP